MLLLLLLLCAASAATAGSVNSSETCQSVECLSLAARMLSMMNRSADPCEDFYAFSCGNFANLVSYSPRKADQDDTGGEWLFETSASQVAEKVEKDIHEMLLLDGLAVDSDPDVRDLYSLTRDFYRSCTKWVRKSESSYFASESLALSSSFMSGVSSRLIEDIDPKVRGRKSLEEILAALVRVSVSSFITLRTPRDFALQALRKNSDLANVPRVLFDLRGKLWSPANADRFGEYISYSKSNPIGKLLSLENISEVYKEMALGLRIAYYFIDGRLMQNCSIQSDTTKFTLLELDAQIQCAYSKSSFSWIQFFEELLQSPVDQNTLIEIKQPATILTFFNYFKHQPVYSQDGDRLSVYTSALILDWFMSFGDFLPTNLQHEWRKSQWLYEGVSTPMRSKFGGIQDCMLWTKSYLQPIVEHMHQSVHHPRPFSEVKDLIRLINISSIDSVRRQSWIKASSHEAFKSRIEAQQSIRLHKLTAQQLKTFYNATLNTLRAMKLSTGRMENNFGSLMSIVLGADARKNFDILSSDSKRQQVAALMNINLPGFSSHSYDKSNRIIFPTALLQPPVYHQSYPGYINLGSLGFIIGHEIGRPFGNYGNQIFSWYRYSDSRLPVVNPRNLVDSLCDNETEVAFLERVRCVAECYGNYHLYPGRRYDNSGSTLRSDISDIIGIKAAFGALQMLKKSQGDMPELANLPADLSQDQLFFIQVAQGMCIKAERSALIAMFGKPESTHSAEHLRVAGMMQNSWEFASTFQCRRGQRMHPVREKCTFW